MDFREALDAVSLAERIVVAGEGCRSDRQQVVPKAAGQPDDSFLGWLNPATNQWVNAVLPMAREPPHRQDANATLN